MHNPRIVSILLCSTLVACVAEDRDLPAIDGPVTETAVTVHADGTLTLARREVSVDEQVAELEARLDAEDGVEVGALSRVVVTTACGTEPYPLMVWDRIDQTGNRSCFKRKVDDVDGYFGYIDLNRVPYDCRMAGFPPRLACTYWNDKVRSYMPGDDIGRFIDNAPEGSEWFRARTGFKVAGPVAMGADQIMLAVIPRPL